ncbi:MAG TPA: glycerophosphodiester phosphodiesterase family protein [Vicinamibacteria bacterium]|nr:glycerophosphodiester phosphodiesterase family protein [Vicinamibacteria bacterium]
MTPLIIAHRGDSAHRPENTLASFKSALDLGADLLELDVQLTKDGQVVVIHDGSVDRTTDGSGRVAELSFAELRKLSAGYPERFGDKYASERVPTLAEVLTLARGRAKVMIEIKKESVTDEEADGIEARTVAVVRDARMDEEVLLISFERRALRRCQRFAPEMRRGHLFHRATPDEVVAGAREVDTDLVMPEKGMLSEELTVAARKAGIKVATWVVDDVEELKDLARFDLFGVGSNRPGALLDAIWASD